MIKNGEKWNDIERVFSTDSEVKHAYLGGDSLRPYIIIETEAVTHVFYLHRKKMTDPPFIGYLKQLYPEVTVDHYCSDYTYFSIGGTKKQYFNTYLSSLPTILLIGLGNKKNYQFARLNLGIARLTQWLRYCGIARASNIDFFLEKEPEIQLKNKLVSIEYDFIGISVNFGQWSQLQLVADMLQQECINAKLIFGNILSAFSRDEIARLYPQEKNIIIAQSYGESILRKLCQQIMYEKARIDIPWLQDILDEEYLICPDENIVQKIYQEGGHVSIETSIGCHYGLCRFCPRNHKGISWMRKKIESFDDIIGRICLGKNNSEAYLSIVDEDFFGKEDSSDSGADHEIIMDSCQRNKIYYEIYTRVNNIFSRKRNLKWNYSRAKVLLSNRKYIKRLFIGVESGSDTQLLRYGKGITIKEIVDTIRVASSLGIKLEYGFITFDPLMNEEELFDNLNFLYRKDILCREIDGDSVSTDGFIYNYIEKNIFYPVGTPLYIDVGYMATELEVLKNSEYCRHLFSKRYDLYTGHYDPNFARYEFRYSDQVVASVAAICRVWTQALFKFVYKCKMKMRVLSAEEGKVYKSIFLKYQKATFFLLCLATFRSSKRNEILSIINEENAKEKYFSLPYEKNNLFDIIKNLGEYVTTGNAGVELEDPLEFDMKLLNQRRMI